MIKKVKILLADDHLILRNGIKLMLSQQKSFLPITEEAENGEEALELALKNSYDIILLDINMPKLDGITVTKKLIKENIQTPILALTMHKEDYIIRQMISAGVTGYILKNTGIDELTKAIVKVMASEPYYCNEASQSLIKRRYKKSKINSPVHVNIDLNNILSDREKQVMMLVVKEYSSPQIAKELNISKRTVDGHRNKIFGKLKIKNAAGLVKFAIENNIK